MFHCAARPGTAFFHADGPCRCFFGGPAPEFGPQPTYNFVSPRPMTAFSAAA